MYMPREMGSYQALLGAVVSNDVKLSVKTSAQLVVCYLVGKNAIRCSNFFLFNFFLDTCVD